MKYCNTPKPYFECNKASHFRSDAILLFFCKYQLRQLCRYLSVSSFKILCAFSEPTSQVLIRIIYTNDVKASVECDINHRYLMFQTERKDNHEGLEGTQQLLQ